MPLRPIRNRFANRSTKRPDFAETVVGAEVGRIRLRHAENRPVQDIGGVDDADPREFRLRQVDHFSVGELPQLVRVVAEVLQPEPRGRGIGNHVRTPVVEDLQTAKLHIGLLDVNPVVADRAVALPVLLADLELFSSSPTVMKSR